MNRCRGPDQGPVSHVRLRADHRETSYVEPSTRRLQKSEVAPPPPESPPPKRTPGLPVWGLNVVECGDTRPNAAVPAFIQRLSFPERRCAVNPWRIPAGP